MCFFKRISIHLEFGITILGLEMQKRMTDSEEFFLKRRPRIPHICGTQVTQFEVSCLQWAALAWSIAHLMSQALICILVCSARQICYQSSFRWTQPTSCSLVWAVQFHLSVFLESRGEYPVGEGELLGQEKLPFFLPSGCSLHPPVLTPKVLLHWCLGGYLEQDGQNWENKVGIY